MPIEKKLQIGIVPFPIAPHLLPMYRLGRELRKLGHETTLIATTDGWENIFRCIRINQQFNAGITKKLSIDTQAPWYEPGKFTLEKAWLNLEPMSFDVLFLDASIRFLPYWAKSLNIPAVSMFCGMPGSNYLNLPTDAFIKPQDSNVSIFMKRLIVELRRPLNERKNHSIEQRYIKKICATRNIPLPNRKLGNYYFNHSSHLTVSPITSLMDYEGNHQNSTYLGSLLPKPVDPDWDVTIDELNSKKYKKNIVISFGTTGISSRRSLRWYIRTCNAIAHHFKDAHVIATVDCSLVEKYIGANLETPQNLTYRNWIPFWEFLKKSKKTILISHAGMNSYREAVCSGTPIVAIPQLYDQPAVAARIETNELGVVIRKKRPSSKILCEAIAKIYDTPKIWENIAAIEHENDNFETSFYLSTLLDKLIK
jgi:UDP:flavonoid glycosyltransferase YjiC (YdhE family)